MQLQYQVLYGLAVDGKLLCWNSRGNEAEFAVNVEFQLTVGNKHDTPWLVPYKTTAEMAAVTNTEWYNAGYDTPGNKFVGRCKVVEVNCTMREL